ncbi:uncharacterized protein LOC122250598 [Penaeus japonicus]|uniref:uncharacterized protein LOC122250598 n=1 Tax=Penaeus japonicus TaxID=27405 RepID=UPI001C7171E2|nr:uncharacterized protein LOC122250598 [Penaeus japonicus]
MSAIKDCESKSLRAKIILRPMDGLPPMGTPIFDELHGRKPGLLMGPLLSEDILMLHSSGAPIEGIQIDPPILPPSRIPTYKGVPRPPRPHSSLLTRCRHGVAPQGLVGQPVRVLAWTEHDDGFFSRSSRAFSLRLNLRKRTPDNYALPWKQSESALARRISLRAPPPQVPSRPCETACVTPEVAAALADLLQRLPRQARSVRIVFEGDVEPCVVASLWRDGVALRVSSESQWWAELEGLTYLEASQHVLVGGITWLTSVMAEVKSFYDTFKLNAQKTRWLWVVSDCTPAPPPPPPQERPATNMTQPPLALPSFAEICDRVSGVLKENVKGVLLVSSEKFLASEEVVPLAPGRWVAIGGVERGGEGSSQLVFVASWTRAGLRTHKPIWPRPPFNFMNRTVKIACIKKPQVFEFKDDASLDDAGGYVVEILKVIRSRHNFTGVLVPTEGFGLRTPNGSYNGMVGVVQRKEADMAALDFTPSLDRTSVVDFSVPIGEDIVVIISRAPDIIIRPFLLLQIFSPLSWLAILASAVLVGVVTHAAGRAEVLVGAERSGGAVSLVEQVVGALKIHVYQSSSARPRGPAAHLVATTGMLVALVVGSLYCGSVTAFLAIPFRSLPVDSVEGLARSAIRPALRSKTLVLQTLTAEGGALHEIRDEVGVFTGAETTSWNFFKTVADGTYALVDVYSSAVGRAMQYERRGEQCQFYLGKVPVKVDLDVFVFAKNSPILFQVDDTIRWLKYFGLIQHIKTKYYSVPCEAEVTSDGPQAMSVQQIKITNHELPSSGVKPGSDIYMRKFDISENLSPWIGSPQFSEVHGNNIILPYLSNRVISSGARYWQHRWFWRHITTKETVKVVGKMLQDLTLMFSITNPKSFCQPESFTYIPYIPSLQQHIGHKEGEVR